MILILQKNTPEPAIRQLLAQLSLQNVKGGCVAGDNAILLPLVGETWRLDPSALQALPFVMEARRLTPAYRLAGRAAHPENTVVTVGDVSIGADFCLIAGPCAVESAYQMDTLSRAVKDAGAQLLRPFFCCLSIPFDLNHFFFDFFFIHVEEMNLVFCQLCDLQIVDVIYITCLI